MSKKHNKYKFKVNKMKNLLFYKNKKIYYGKDTHLAKYKNKDL